MNNALLEEAKEMLMIHQRLRYEAQMILQSYPRWIREIDDEIARLTCKRGDLEKRFATAETDIQHYESLIANDENSIHRFHQAPPRTQRQLTTVEKVAKIKRLAARIEKELAAEFLETLSDGE